MKFRFLTFLNLLFSIALLTFIFLYSSQKIKAQAVERSPTLDLYINRDTGSLWNDRSAAALDSMINNQLAGQMEMGRLLLLNIYAENAIREVQGNAKIEAGKATTHIKYSPQNSIVQQIAAKIDSPQEQKEMKQAVTVSLETFNNILKSKRLTPYDAADGRALSFVLCYLAYKGEDPGDARLLKLSRWLRNEQLKSAYFQGGPDVEKQQFYELQAFNTMLAVRAFQQSKQNDLNPQQKKEALSKARGYAEGVLKELWTNGNLTDMQLSATGNGFTSKGDAIIENGKATTTFDRSNTILTAQKFAKEYTISETKVAQLMRDFDAEVKRRNGATNDGAWANAVAFTICYEVYTDGQIKLNQQQFNWILKEMQKDMLNMADYQANTNEQKQEYYENVGLKAISIYDKFRNEGPSAGIRLPAVTTLVNIFQPRNFDEYTLSPTGFVKK